VTEPFRFALAHDAPRLAALINQAFLVERFFIDGDRTDAAEVRGMMERGQFLMAEEGGRLVGCVYVEVRGERGYFGLLAVAPGLQGHGLGRRLVAAAEAHAREAGCRFMDLQVVDLREELPPFYRRLGYVETGTAPFPAEARPKRPCHFIVMSKALL
jgi:GNAT superfamily N-acetyltransferase